MDLNGLSRVRPVPMKAFPPGRLGVLLPLDDRRTAALGLCLYTTSKAWVVALQKAAHLLVSVTGARALPGRTELWAPPCSADEWRSLVAAWHDALGPFDGLTCYRPRQQARSGLILLLTRRGKSLALVKIRTERKGSLDVEQAALAAVVRCQPRTFRAPRPLGAGEVGQFGWSAQEAVFTAPHEPVLQASPELFHEVAACLAGLASSWSAGPDHRDDSKSVGVLSHGDLTPWNLRRDAQGRVWLFDWADVGPAPVDSDRVYFCAAARSLGGPPMPTDLSVDAVAHVRTVVQQHHRANPENADLARALVKALEEAGEARTALNNRPPR